MWKLSVLWVLWAGCSPEGRVLLDGRRVADLGEASRLAVPGSRIELQGGTHTGGVVLPDGVVLRGPRASIVGEARLVEGLGDLTVQGVRLDGGSGEGGALYVDGNLVLEDVVVEGVRDDVAIRGFGKLSMTDSTVVHPDGTAVRILTPQGRPAEVGVHDCQVDGLLDVPGDHVEIAGLGGEADVLVFGHSLLMTDSQVRSVAFTGPAAFLAGVHVAETGFVDAAEANLLDASGGSWTLQVDQLTAVGWLASEVSGYVGDASMSGGLSERLELTGTDVELTETTANLLRVVAPTITAFDIEAHALHLEGGGTAQYLLVDGPTPSVWLGPLDVAGAVVRSTSAPIRMDLEGTLVRGMAVVEPSNVSLTNIHSSSFANLFHVTWHGGGNATFADGGAFQVSFYNSIVSRAEMAAHVAPTFLDSVWWDPDGVDAVPLGATFGDPHFVAPDDPHLAPDSPFLDKGAFAGPTAEAVELLWSRL